MPDPRHAYRNDKKGEKEDATESIPQSIDTGRVPHIRDGHPKLVGQIHLGADGSGLAVVFDQRHRQLTAGEKAGK